jgi:RNA polymerase sigma factor (sigma-70 family)
MADDPSFRDLIRRVRVGDEAAAAELVRRFEPSIRRMVRVRLRDSRLDRHFDSRDICQSVLASFFVRAALDQYQLDEPRQLLNLLAAMARNKLVNQVHRQQAACRDYRREEPAGDDIQEVMAPGPSPSRQLTVHELLQEARRRLSPEERRLLEFREQGCEWADIAAALGGSSEALRKKLARAVERISHQLGLDEADHA